MADIVALPNPQRKLYVSGMSNLSSRMRAAMKAAGLNQPQLAEAASTPDTPVSQQTVHQLVSGRNTTSKHLPAVAADLGISLEWLATGRGGKSGKGRADALLTGKVGAGGIVEKFPGGPVLAGYASPGGSAPNVVEISGDSQRPFEDGWLVFYGPEQQGVSEECLGKLCVVQTRDGETLLTTLRQGSQKGMFHLESWKSQPKKNVKLQWAARVVDISPT
jgi:transcriptional regulator with XRE-family HTH domain